MEMDTGHVTEERANPAARVVDEPERCGVGYEDVVAAHAEAQVPQRRLELVRVLHARHVPRDMGDTMSNRGDVL